MHRFFLPPEVFSGEPPSEICLASRSLPGGRDLVHQIATVLRLRAGDVIQALDGQGRSYTVELAWVDRKEVRGQISSVTGPAAPPRVQVSLYVSPLRRENFEWVLQKGAELGVSHFAPLLCERTVDRPKGLPERWSRILIEASEQSGRFYLPRLDMALTFSDALRHGAGSGILFHEGANRPLSSDLLRGLLKQAEAGQARPGETCLHLFIGPEGGFAPAEVTQAQQAGLPVISLGANILRAETAAISAVALTMFLLGEAGDASAGTGFRFEG